VVGDASPDPQAQAVTPSLEDAYAYLLGPGAQVH
jgi:hypothetical protein